MKVCFGLLIVVVTASIVTDCFGQQPRVTTAESLPAKKLAGIISLPESPWCRGNPTYWLPGHKSEDDAPNCFINGKWVRPNWATMDNSDDLNAIDGPEVIDRHDCATMDINNDGVLDLYCTVGANSGRGAGFNEIYLTRKDGSLFKIRRHGLQRWTGMRTRHTTVLRDVNGTEMVFLATLGIPRDDGMSNKHRMFKKTGKWHNNPNKRYFTHFPGPWRTYSDAKCAVTADINRDGLDDLIVCNFREWTYLYLQSEDGQFRRYPWLSNRTTQSHWRNVRIADFNGDGLNDMAVVFWGQKTNSRLEVFRGTKKPPYFDFTGPAYYKTTFPFAVVDLEVLDVQEDGLLDLYVVLSDETVKGRNATELQRAYCAGTFKHGDWWKNGNQPPNDFVPPPDNANDVLLLGSRGTERFTTVTMEHSEPGCGNLVRSAGNKTLYLAQGGFVRPGHNLVLNW